MSNNCIQTYTGKQFSPDTPRPEDLDIRDIAHSLSLLCRYNGHCQVFYSVADHSVRVSRQCPPEAALWGLLHDLGEAYLGDMPRPIKAFFPDYATFEDRLLKVAAGVFGLGWPMPPEVRAADDLLLVTEMRDLMVPMPDVSELGLEPLPERVVPLSPLEAERAYLARYEELTS